MYLVVLMSSQQLLCLLITQLLSKGGQQVAELGGADEPIAILHFVTQVKCLMETITLSKCRRPSMKSSLVSVDRREQIALNKQIGFGLEYMNKYNL